MSTLPTTEQRYQKTALDLGLNWTRKVTSPYYGEVRFVDIATTKKAINTKIGGPIDGDDGLGIELDWV
jgi:hypothetical protein